MRYNKVLVADQVRSKLTDKCVTALITEAFVRALPLTREEVALEAVEFGKYSMNVLKTMKPETLLKNALESTTLNPKAKAYLENFSSVVESIVEESTRSIMADAEKSDESAEDIYNNADFSKVDKMKLVNASKQAGIAEVAEVVKKKVIDTIKNEKETYEESQKIRDDIREVLKKDPVVDGDSDAEAIENYLDIILTPNEPRHHVSFFSKLQDVCIENLMYSNEEYNTEIPYKTLTKITLESTLPYFDLSYRTIEDEISSISLVKESMTEIRNSDSNENSKMKNIAKTAFICSICITTLLEVLKTMNLRSPSLGEVKDFVDSATNVKKNNLDKIVDDINSSAELVNKSVAMGAMSAIEALNAKEHLTNLKKTLESIQMSNEIVKNKILNNLTSAIEGVEKCCADNLETINTMDSPSIFVTRIKETNIAEIDHVIKIMNKKPLVRSIEFRIPSEKKSGGKECITVFGKDDAGNSLASYMINIDANTDFGDTVVQCVKECAQYADLGNKPVYIYFTDSCYSVPLK